MNELTEVETRLSAQEADRFDDLEICIANGLQTFVEVGNALAEIRDGKLYRLHHATFEDYCQNRWGLKRAHAYRMIDAASVISNLSPIGDIPQTESQARPLASLTPEQQREVWQTAVDTAPNGKMTAAHVEATVKEIMSQTPGVMSSGGSNGVNMQTSNGRDVSAMMSSASDEWYTTQEIIDTVTAVMGGIDLDPASSDTANETVRAEVYFTIEDDGLSKEWWGRVYLNPPYGNEIPKWVDKAIGEYENHNILEAVLLLPSRTDTRWFRALRQFPRCFMHGRVKFNGHDNSAPFPTMLVGIGIDLERFAKIMQSQGDIYLCHTISESN